MGYLESMLTVPIESDRHLVYLPCSVHGGRHETAADVAKLSDTLARLGNRRFVFASTAALYDGLALGPYAPALETVRLRDPSSWYLLTKRTQEEMVRLSGVDAVVLRFGAIVGPAPTMRWDLLPNAMVWRAVTTGEIPVTMPRASRAFLGINDAVRAVEWALTAPAGTYNIATINCGVMAYAETVAERCGARVVLPGEPPHVPSFAIDCTKAERAGWHRGDDLTALIDGLRDLAEAWQPA